MSYSVDMSLPPEDMLLGIINYENPKAHLTFKICKFSEAGVSNSGRLDRDSKIDLIALIGAPFYGTLTFYYNRVNLNNRLGSRVINAELSRYVDTRALLPLVLTQFGINLTAADVYNDQIPVGATQIAIRTSPRSLAYKGTVIVVNTETPDTSLKARIVNRLLNGFDIEGYRP